MATPDKQVRDCFSLIAKTLLHASKGLTPRERLALEAGLSASHAEEALVVGDIARAQAHFDKLLATARKLEGASY